ncbi:MAG: nucleotidyltransferase domain-containing protein [Leptospiraceae bacterium]|nr:nucleotidyltransferase domain-containing protein [Leptospiraceae bacterium]
MDKIISEKISTLKTKYESKGLIILGVFGSFARGEETPNSDIDILYTCTEKTYQEYPGWDFYVFLEDVKKDFESELGRKVDFAEREALSNIGKKFILPEVFYV